MTQYIQLINTKPEPGSDGIVGGFANREGAQLYLDEVVTLWAGEAVAAGQYVLQDAELGAQDEPHIVVSLDIENAYEGGDSDDSDSDDEDEDEDEDFGRYEIKTRVVDAFIPAPPGDEDHDDFDDWKQENIICWSGTGRTEGDSWYDITVTACSDETLIGATYDFGY